MTAKELERLLALRTGFGAAHLDQTTRALRAAGLLPAGRRGRGARSLDGIDAAMVLIALAAADQPAKAPPPHEPTPACVLSAAEGHRRWLMPSPSPLST